MATITKYNIIYTAESNPIPLVDDAYTTKGTDDKFYQVTDMRMVKQIVEDILDNQITPADPSNPPLPLVSIIIQRQKSYVEST
jgi:hypothetical protein